MASCPILNMLKILQQYKKEHINEDILKWPPFKRRKQTKREIFKLKDNWHSNNKR